MTTGFDITKEFAFSAAHRLTGLHQDHPCSRLHGHNYIVKVELGALVTNSVGFVRDYGDLDKVKYYIDTVLDHRYLGFGDLLSPLTGETLPERVKAVLTFNPTAENMAEHIYWMAKEDYPELAAVGVSETPKTYAWFRHEGV